MDTVPANPNYILPPGPLGTPKAVSSFSVELSSSQPPVMAPLLQNGLLCPQNGILHFQASLYPRSSL